VDRGRGPRTALPWHPLSKSTAGSLSFRRFRSKAFRGGRRPSRCCADCEGRGQRRRRLAGGPSGGEVAARELAQVGAYPSPQPMGCVQHACACRPIGREIPNLSVPSGITSATATTAFNKKAPLKELQRGSALSRTEWRQLRSHCSAGIRWKRVPDRQTS
jgi:hypothetical protein